MAPIRGRPIRAMNKAVFTQQESSFPTTKMPPTKNFMKIKTVVKMRAFLERNGVLEKNKRDCIRCDEEQKTIELDNHLFADFDHVYASSIQQNKIYEDLVEPSIPSLLNGKCVTFMAYGQTGSGKTFTIIGNRKIPQSGFIYMAIDQLLTLVKKKSMSSKLYVSCVELYGIVLRDLLLDHGEEKRLLSIKDGYDMPFIRYAKAVKIKNAADGVDYLRLVVNRRETKANAKNDESSRSHCLFAIYLSRGDEILEDSIILDFKTISAFKSRLVFLDLAGSEKNSVKNTLESVRESCGINFELFCLRQKMTEFVKPKRNVNVNVNERIPQMIKDTFTGQAETTIIFCVSPCEIDIVESLNTLDFGYQTGQVRLSKVKTPLQIQREREAKMASQRPNIAKVKQNELAARKARILKTHKALNAAISNKKMPVRIRRPTKSSIFNELLIRYSKLRCGRKAEKDSPEFEMLKAINDYLKRSEEGIADDSFVRPPFARAKKTRDSSPSEILKITEKQKQKILNGFSSGRKLIDIITKEMSIKGDLSFTKLFKIKHDKGDLIREKGDGECVVCAEEEFVEIEEKADKNESVEESEIETSTEEEEVMVGNEDRIANVQNKDSDDIHKREETMVVEEKDTIDQIIFELSNLIQMSIDKTPLPTSYCFILYISSANINVSVMPIPRLVKNGRIYLGGQDSADDEPVNENKALNVKPLEISEALTNSESESESSDCRETTDDSSDYSD